jgi:hypothetical protein
LHCRMGYVSLCRKELQSYLDRALPDEHNQDIQTFLRSLPQR